MGNTARLRGPGIFSRGVRVTHGRVTLIFREFAKSRGPGREVGVFFGGRGVRPVSPFLSGRPTARPLIRRALSIRSDCVEIGPFILPCNGGLSGGSGGALNSLNSLERGRKFCICHGGHLVV